MPAERRPPVVEPPRLSWESCKELQAMLCQELGVLEEAGTEHTREWRSYRYFVDFGWAAGGAVAAES